MFVRRAPLAMPLLATLLAATGCGRSYETDATAILRAAKATVDGASALHFTVTSQNAQGGGTLITGAQGDARRPDSFQGSLTVLQNGFTVTVQIVSVGGTFYAKVPFSSRFEAVDPSRYGFGDPALLLDPNRGLSSLASEARSVRLADRDRRNGEELYEVEAMLPGGRVADLLTSADRSRDVAARFGIDVDDHQLRRVVLTGPFFDKTHDSTYTLVLDNYGENIAVTPPL